VNDAEVMKTYTAETNDEACMAFRAMDDDDARIWSAMRMATCRTD
jgi:hypothetical protein